MLSKKLIWSVTLGTGALLLLLVVLIYRFLAVNYPQRQGILIVEAWIPQKTLEESIRVFRSGTYEYMAVVGGPIRGSGSAVYQPGTFADRAAGILLEHGFDATQLIKIEVPAVSQNRTAAMLSGAKRWIKGSRIEVCCVDVFTAGVHARKSWILAQHAFGSGYQVGVIAGTESSFNPKLWFASRKGIRIVLRNLAGYVYYKVWMLFNAG